MVAQMNSVAYVKPFSFSRCLKSLDIFISLRNRKRGAFFSWKGANPFVCRV